MIPKDKIRVGLKFKIGPHIEEITDIKDGYCTLKRPANPSYRGGISVDTLIIANAPKEI